MEILLVNDADDVVYRFMVDRQAGIAARFKRLRQLFHRILVRNSHNVHARGENLADFHVVKFNRAADELALAIGQLAVVFGLANHRQQLRIGDHVHLTAAKEAGNELLPRAEDKIQRGKQRNEQIQHRRAEDRKLLGHLLGQALGRDFAEDEHSDGDHHGRNRRAIAAAEDAGEEHRTH